MGQPVTPSRVIAHQDVSTDGPEKNVTDGVVLVSLVTNVKALVESALMVRVTT